MPAVLGIHSFSFRDTAADRLIVTAGSAVYDAVNLPGGSGSRTSLGGSALAFRAPWYDDVNATQFEPSGEALWMHARYYTAANVAGNDVLRIGVGRNGTEYITVSAEASTNKLTIRVAGTVRATAASAAFSLSSWARIHIEVTGDDAGDMVHVYANGNLSTPVVSYTLIAGDASALAGVGKPNEFICALKADGNERVDDFVAWDPDDAAFPGISPYAAAYITDQDFIGPGAEQQWAGAATDIDEKPPDNADKITASAVGNESTFTKPAIDADNVFAVVLRARVERTGSAAGESITLIERAGGDNEQATMAAPGDGAVQHIFEVAPDGVAWTPAKYDAARLGFVAAT